jgi:class 3 adenylate cyclase
LVAEQKKSQELLANILPAHVIEELKEKGYSQPHSYNNVSVIFTDFKGFTKLASKMTAENVVKELNVCFEKFDEIMEKYNLDKIKTIGDGYMAAGGFFNSERQAVQAVEACLEMLEFMEEIKNEKISKGEPVWELRVGIHTGPVVAGVIGKKKFAYDIWGDTVNLASRMESSGMAGKLNISEATYELVKDHFECTPRGKIEAKNAGEIEMFFVERKKSEKFLEKNLEF